MPRKITDNLQAHEAISILGKVEVELTHLKRLIEVNKGKDPILWRRTDSLISKTNELIEKFEEEL